MRVGVLALQGAFREHAKVLQRLDTDAVEVRKPSDLAGMDGFVIPGGESTTIRTLMAEYGLLSALSVEISAGLPVMGTCAGMIVLSERVDGQPMPGPGGLDIDVRRNAFGRQVDSFEADLNIPVLGEEPFHAVFIRAPVVESVGPGVEVLSRLPDGRIVGVQQGSVVALAFHPELSCDDRFHKYFLQLVGGRQPVGPRQVGAPGGELLAMPPPPQPSPARGGIFRLGTR